MPLEDLEDTTLQILERLLKPLMEEKRMRKQLLKRALGVKAPVLGNITAWDDPYWSFITDMAEQLASYRLETSKSALRKVLEFVKSQRMVGEDGCSEIDKLLDISNKRLPQITQLETGRSPPTPPLPIIFLSHDDTPKTRKYCTASKSIILEQFSWKWQVYDREQIGNKDSFEVERCYQDAKSWSMYVGIIGSEYDDREETGGKSPTEVEFDAAIKICKNLVIFMPKNSDSCDPKQQDFIKHIQEVVKNHPSNTTIIQEDFESATEFTKRFHEYLLELERQTRSNSQTSESLQSQPFLGVDPGQGYDSRPVLLRRLIDLDEAKVAEFLGKIQAQEELMQYNLLQGTQEEKLELLKLLHNDHPTLGAFLCFARKKSLQGSIVACSLDMVDRTNPEYSSPHSVQDNLLRLIEIGMEFIDKTINSSGTGLPTRESETVSPVQSTLLSSQFSSVRSAGFTESNQQSESEIPREALREALVNAIIHRDYETEMIRNLPIRVAIHPNKVEITSYGSLIDDVPVTALNRDGGVDAPFPKNLIIGKIFKIMEIARLSGEGIKIIRELTTNVNLPPPEIIHKRGERFVKVIFYRNSPVQSSKQFTASIASSREITTSPKSSIGRPRDFTVQIRNLKADEIVGTGIIASFSGEIVTCTHVVRDALREQPIARKMKVGVYFPRLPAPHQRAYEAEVLNFMTPEEDDIALLQLIGTNLPILSSEQVAVFGIAEHSFGHSFSSYGFRRLAGGVKNYTGGVAEGRILCTVDKPLDRNLQAEPIQLQSNQIDQGMSGAPVFDTERNLVVGIILDTFFPGISTKDRDTAWAVNASVLRLPQFNLPVQD